MNIITGKVYQNIKDYNGLVLIGFREGRRVITVSGLDYIRAMHEVMEYSTRNTSVIVFRKEDYPDIDTTIWEEDYYRNHIDRYSSYKLDNEIGFRR